VLQDSSTLQVTTPPGTAGAVGVLVRAALTGQAVVAPAAFTYLAPQSGGGGGGGCTLGDARRGGPFDGFSALLPVLLAVGVMSYGARHRRQQVRMGG
jgi:hypothetical protein